MVKEYGKRRLSLLCLPAEERLTGWWEAVNSSGYSDSKF